MKNAMVMRFVKWRIAAWGARVTMLQKTLMRAPETPERNGRKVATFRDIVTKTDPFPAWTGEWSGSRASSSGRPPFTAAAPV